MPAFTIDTSFSTIEIPFTIGAFDASGSNVDLSELPPLRANGFLRHTLDDVKERTKPLLAIGGSNKGSTAVRLRAVRWQQKLRTLLINAEKEQIPVRIVVASVLAIASNMQTRIEGYNDRRYLLPHLSAGIGYDTKTIFNLIGTSIEASNITVEEELTVNPDGERRRGYRVEVHGVPIASKLTEAEAEWLKDYLIRKLT